MKLPLRVLSVALSLMRTPLALLPEIRFPSGGGRKRRWSDRCRRFRRRRWCFLGAGGKENAVGSVAAVERAGGVGADVVGDDLVVGGGKTSMPLAWLPEITLRSWAPCAADDVAKGRDERHAVGRVACDGCAVEFDADIVADDEHVPAAVEGNAAGGRIDEGERLELRAGRAGVELEPAEMVVIDFDHRRSREPRGAGAVDVHGPGDGRQRTGGESNGAGDAEIDGVGPGVAVGVQDRLTQRAGAAMVQV